MTKIIRHAVIGIFIFGSCFTFAETRSNNQVSSLAELAESKDLTIGTFFFNTKEDGIKGEMFSIEATKEFNLITLPIFSSQVWKGPGQPFDWTIVNHVLEDVPENFSFRIPAMIWCGHVPKWLKTGSYTGDEIKKFMFEYLSGIVNFMKKKKLMKKVVSWDVVNEPISYQSDQNKCVWHKIGLEDNTPSTGGYYYIELALKHMRKIAPSAKLYINNFGTEGNSPWSNKMFNLVKQLKSPRKKIPLDGVGFQSHFMVQEKCPPRPNEFCPKKDSCPPCFPLFDNVPAQKLIETTLNKIGDLGLETMITELDISIKDNASRQDSVFQAAGFKRVFQACINANSCKSVSVWGVGDSDSWIPKDTPKFKGWGRPLIFDKDYKKKTRIYNAVKNTLK